MAAIRSGAAAKMRQFGFGCTKPLVIHGEHLGVPLTHAGVVLSPSEVSFDGAMMACTRSSMTRRTWIGTLVLCSLLIAAAAAFVIVNPSSCPFDATAIEPGASIQAMVDHAGEGAASV